MRTYKSFIIRFIRDTDKENKDDKLTITPDYDNSPETFRIEFKYSACHINTNKNVIHRFYLQKNDIHTYIQSILKLTKHDSEPFESIQLDIPGHPTYLLNTLHSDEINSLLNDSLYILLSTEESWPFEDSPEESTPPSQLNTHKYFDSDGETISDDDDNDSYVCI
jgi:hypothetical protein